MSACSNNTRRLAATLCLAAGLLAPGLGLAQATSPGWNFSATLYGYFPSVGGETSFPVKTGGGSVDISASDVIDSIDFVFMGTFDVHNGRWGAFTDVMYLDLGGSKSASRDFTIGGLQIPANTTANLGWDMKGVIWTLAGQYRVAGGAGLTMDLLAGARLVDLEQEASWDITGSLGPLAPPARTGRGEAEVSQWDGIVGLKGRYTFAEAPKWSLPFYVDVGTGESDLTWQVVAGVSYAFSWGELGAGWRYLEYDMKSGRPIKDLNFSGAMVGATFRW
ncbi:MAG: hypothetical protein EHM74_09770, partial [Hyphomicrobiales bacterium]